MDKRLMSLNENVYYLWKMCFLHQFIPLVHHLLFLRMYNSDNSAQNMNYVGLMDRDPVHPSFMGLKSAVLVSNGIEFRMPNVPGFFSSHMKMKFLKM